MTSENPNKIDELLKTYSWSQGKTDYSRNGYYFNSFVYADRLLMAVSEIKENGYILEDISGVDVLEGIMIVYHFDRIDRSARISIRTVVPHDSKKVPSIVSIYSGADWHERECFDFFGVIFENHPNLKPLLLPDNMGFHPLLKEKERRSFYTLLPFEMLVDRKVEPC